jgi:hypothetical protein
MRSSPPVDHRFRTEQIPEPGPTQAPERTRLPGLLHQSVPLSYDIPGQAVIHPDQADIECRVDPGVLAVQEDLGDDPVGSSGTEFIHGGGGDVKLPSGRFVTVFLLKPEDDGCGEVTAVGQFTIEPVPVIELHLNQRSAIHRGSRIEDRIELLYHLLYQDFNLDRSEVKRIVETNLAEMARKLGINHWEIKVVTDLYGDEVSGECTRLLDYESARINLNVDLMDDEEKLLRILRHELFHIVLSPFDLLDSALARMDLAADVKALLERIFDNCQEHGVRNLERMWNASQPRVEPEPESEPEPGPAPTEVVA